jgi:hypothetical protein
MKQIIAILALIVCGASMAQAQTKTPQPTTVFIPVNTEPSIAYKYHDGTAFLTNGSYLKGRFQYNGGSTFLYRSSSQAPKQRIGLSMIRRLALAGSDTLVTDRTDSTVFVKLGTRLYRQLAGGGTMILDRRYAVDEERGKLGPKMFVLDENSELHKFKSLQKLNRWFYAFNERSGKKRPDVYLNENEIVKAVAKLNTQGE